MAGLAGFLLGFILRNYRDIFFAMLTQRSRWFFSVLSSRLSLWAQQMVLLSQCRQFLGWLRDQVSTFCHYHFGWRYSCSCELLFKDNIWRLTTAIRDNEIRVEYLGFSVAHAIHLKYTISTILAGGAGALMAMSLGQVDPESMINWTVSGELVFVTISQVQET